MNTASPVIRRTNVFHMVTLIAQCVVVVAASVAASASAVTIDFATITNGGNPGNPSSSPAGLGSVADGYFLSRTETTNAQYVEFLNAVDASGTNPNSVYNNSMGSSAIGGIVFDGSAASGFKYGVKSGAPAGAPGGTSYGNMPVNFVSWFSAARFINWMANNQQTGAAGTASMEFGSYTLANATSGSIVARNANATIFLPSVDEWYKAAFYSGSGATYNLYATNSSTTPTASITDLTTANTANFGGVFTAPIGVGSYVNTTSAYGVYDMFGNVTEMTDSSTAGQYRAMGGGFGGSAAAWDAQASAFLKTGDFVNQSYGFRVAAVPEPSTYALACFAVAGVVGARWLRRRRGPVCGSIMAA